MVHFRVDSEITLLKLEKINTIQEDRLYKEDVYHKDSQPTYTYEDLRWMNTCND